MNHAPNHQINKYRLLSGSFLPGLLFSLMLVSIMALLLLWTGYDRHTLYDYGVFPRTWSGLKGIVFSPFIHQAWGHLGANAWSFVGLTTLLSVYFPGKWWQLWFRIYLLTGLYTWCLGREASHIGASGLNYGLVSLFFFFGVFRWHRRYLSISLLMVFLYGSMIWGLLPIDPMMSWEAHLAGSLSGLLLAFIYRNTSREQEPKEFEWEDEKPDEEVPPEENTEEIQAPKVVYHYKPKEPPGEEDRL